MEKFGWRGFCEIFVAGVLLITAGYFAVRHQLIAEEYTTYRDGIFARAYESITLTLATYLETGSPDLAPQLADRFAEHGGNDQCVSDAHDAENGYVKFQQREEQEKCQTAKKQRAADDIIELLHFLQKTIRDDETDVTECKGCRADGGDEAV